MNASLEQLGIAEETFDYVLAFTLAHEGDTPFMYNNWPWKNQKVDVTAGVGLAVVSEDHAASGEIRGLFKLRSNKEPASEQDMRQEYRRVAALARTPKNLFSAYRDMSPLYIERDAMLQMLRTKLLAFWQQKGQDFPSMESIPAQAQAALISWNYGLRLRSAPKMCNAIRNGDYVTAAAESRIAGWDGQKNAAHRVLLMNAGAIVQGGLELSMLPPVAGPFNPPPSVEAAGPIDEASLLGSWSVAIGEWHGVFAFDQNGDVSWSDVSSNDAHTGHWSLKGDHVEWQFQDPGDFRVFTLPLPVVDADAAGTILPEGQGVFSMSKVAA